MCIHKLSQGLPGAVTSLTGPNIIDSVTGLKCFSCSNVCYLSEEELDMAVLHYTAGITE